MGWQYTWVCTSHVGSNGIKWGMAPHASEDTHDNIAIPILALRSSSQGLFKVVNQFVHMRVVYEGPPDISGARRQLWEHMGVDAKLLDQVLLANPMYKPEREYLSVSQALLDDPDRHEAIADIILYFMRWRSFTPTRWAGMVPCARMMICSVLVGIQRLVPMVYESSDANTEKLGGFKRLKQPELLYLSVASLGMRPAYVFALKLLHDDRFLKHAQNLWAGLQEEAARIITLHSDVWEILAGLCPDCAEDGVALRHLTFTAMHTAIAYIHCHSFELLETLPFKLTQGCIERRVQELGAMTYDEVQDPLARNIWLCLHFGCCYRFICARIAPHARCTLLDRPC